MLFLYTFFICIIHPIYSQQCNSKENIHCSSETNKSIFRFCELTPESGEGPFFIDEDIIRSDITEKKLGHPLSLNLFIFDKSCKPFPNVKVSLWQPDCAGIYSGFINPPPIKRGPMFPTDEYRWLRGTQITDSEGKVFFSTIFPGFYRGRTSHIHLRIQNGSRIIYIGQIFFPEEITNWIVSKPPYFRGNVKRTTNEEDGEFRHFFGEKMIVSLMKSDHLNGTMKIVVDPNNISELTWA